LTLPLLMAARLAKRNMEKSDFDPLSEFRLSPVANSFLKGVLKMERLTIEGGVRWPVGGSLLLVAASGHRGES